MTGFTKRSDPAVLGVEIEDKDETINFLFLRSKLYVELKYDWRTKSIRAANLEGLIWFYCMLKVRECKKASLIIERLTCECLTPVRVTPADRLIFTKQVLKIKCHMYYMGSINVLS